MVVTTSRLLSTGVDVPTCKNIVLARPVNSIVEFKQIIGRGTRLLEPQKTWFTIVDYAGATKHFYDEEWDGDPQFVDLDTLIPASPPAVAGTEDQKTTEVIQPTVSSDPEASAPTQPDASTTVSEPGGSAPTPPLVQVEHPATISNDVPSSVAGETSPDAPDPGAAPAPTVRDAGRERWATDRRGS